MALMFFCASPALADDSAFAEQLVRTIPKLALLKAHDQAAFDRIVQVYAEGERQHKPVDEMVGEARGVFVQVQHDRLVQAPDAILLKALDSMLNVARDLEAKSPERCAALFGGGNAGDIKALLSPASIASEDAVYDSTLTYLKVAAPQPATMAEENAFIARTLADQAAEKKLLPQDFVRQMFGSPISYCSATRALFENMRRDPNAAALFRRRLMGGPTE
jgi:hypothetical protein